MSIVWAIGAAFGWGVADFLARIASDKIGSRSTVFFVQLGSLAALLVVLAATGGVSAATWAPRVIVATALAALLNAAGMTLFYEAIRRGPVSLVSPISSSFGGITALLALVGGERATPAQLIGLVAIVVGIAGSTAQSDGGAPNGVATARGGVALGVVVAVLWGASFFLLTPAFATFGRVLPIAVCRAVTVSLHTGYSLALRRPWSRPGAAWPVLVAISVLDTAGFFAYGASLQGGLTSVSAVIASLFSTITVLLAAIVLRERLRGAQWLAVALLLAGIGLAAKP